MRLNPCPGETWLRITPPTDSQPGYSQSGTVELVTETTIEMRVLCDVPRRMTFSRETGFDTSGRRTFLVRPDPGVS